MYNPMSPQRLTKWCICNAGINKPRAKNWCLACRIEKIVAKEIGPVGVFFLRAVASHKLEEWSIGPINMRHIERTFSDVVQPVRTLLEPDEYASIEKGDSLF